VIRKSIVLSALILGFTTVAGSAQAAPITTSCPGTLETTDREFTLTTEPGSVCRGYQPGNINGNDDYINDVLDGVNFWTTLDKSDDGMYPNALTVTGGPNSGTFSFTPALWTIYDRIIVGLKSGNGQYDPDWAAFELVPYASSGEWTVSINGLSHINLYGHGTTTRTGGDDPGSPVPEPASLFLFGSGVALVARKIRRRSA